MVALTTVVAGEAMITVALVLVEVGMVMAHRAVLIVGLAQDMIKEDTDIVDLVMDMMTTGTLAMEVTVMKEIMESVMAVTSTRILDTNHRKNPDRMAIRLPTLSANMRKKRFMLRRQNINSPKNASPCFPQAAEKSMRSVKESDSKRSAMNSA